MKILQSIQNITTSKFKLASPSYSWNLTRMFLFYNYSIAVPRALFDLKQNKNYSAIDSCFHPCAAISIDHWVLQIL